MYDNVTGIAKLPVKLTLTHMLCNTLSLSLLHTHTHKQVLFPFQFFYFSHS